MKFPRNARIFKGHLDAAPFAGVFFCTLIFILLGTFVYTPGVQINLPASHSELPGATGPLVSVALGPGNQLYFENQVIRASELKYRLADEVRKSPEVTLMILQDAAVTAEQQVALIELGRSAGITNFWEAIKPRVLEASGGTNRP
jgi:biopolymer transport protein ExbD